MAVQLRIGLVLYGGASLAVYMGGMAQELLALVRAAQARKVLRGATEAAPALRDWARREVTANPYGALLEAVDAEVVIDVIAGTSAGGLNGLLLAKALAVGAPQISDLADEIWRRKADMEALARHDPDPKAILSGDYLQAELEALLHAVDQAGRPELADLVRVLDLYVTATDVRGHDWTRYDRLGQRVQGRSHRYLFQLRKRTQQKGGLRGYDRNDFACPDRDRCQRINRLLAQIGQATAAFPGVFPPVRIRPADAREAGIDVLTDVGSACEDGIWFSDGGILVNAPFEPVLDTICQRAATQRVRRLLVFLEPDPDTGPAPAQTEPSLLETAAAAVALPMQQDIFEQLTRLQAENQRRRQVAALVESLDGASAESGRTRTYWQMRLHRLRQALGGALSQALSGVGLAADRAQGAAALLVERLAPLPPDWGASHLADVLGCLERYDAAFHARRLQYLLATVHEQAQGDLPARLLDRLWGALEDWQNASWVIANAGRLGAQPARWQRLTEHLDRAMVRFAEAAGAEAMPAMLAGATDGLVSALGRYLDGVYATTAEELLAALAEEAKLQQRFDRFQAVDQVLFPLELGAGRGGWGEIGLYGFRASAAQSWIAKTTAEKLTGEALGHFAAFLDARWRANDLMWGRLDAAELVFRMVARETGTEEADARLTSALLARRRQILAAFPDLIDRRRLQALTTRQPTAGEPGAARFTLWQRMAGCWHRAVRSEVAPSLMAVPPAEPLTLEQVPERVLRDYLTREYRVGQEGLEALPAGRLATEALLMLDNLVTALGRSRVSPLMVWLQRLPRKRLGRRMRAILMPFVTGMGMLLLFGWAVGLVAVAAVAKPLLALWSKLVVRRRGRETRKGAGA